MIREITITPVLNGFVCKVGCQKVVFQSPSELARAVERYYKNPDETEKEFLAGAVNKMNEGPCAVAEPPRERVTAGEEACDSICETRNPTPQREIRR
jgi:hypothetical protein